jgi:hypothetical protein
MEGQIYGSSINPAHNFLIPREKDSHSDLALQRITRRSWRWFLSRALPSGLPGWPPGGLPGGPPGGEWSLDQAANTNDAWILKRSRQRRMVPLADSFRVQGITLNASSLCKMLHTSRMLELGNVVDNAVQSRPKSSCNGCMTSKLRQTYIAIC